MGILVMDECFDEWKINKTKEGYGRFFDDWAEKDLVSMLHRDRNHPSIILWSIGNEVTEGFIQDGNKIAQPLMDICHREDPTRLATSACQQPNKAVKFGFDKILDIFGVNYQPGMYVNAEVHAREKMIASETASAVDSRSEYGLSLDGGGNVQIMQQPDEQKHQVSSYDFYHPGWATNAEVEEIALQKAPWVAGEFIWTGIDYIGEPTPFDWPSRSSYFGALDLCGFPKDRYYMYKCQWGSDPAVHILPMSWTWPGFEGKNIPVWVYTNADSVELFLNDKSLGIKNFPADTETVEQIVHQKDKPANKYPSVHLAWSVSYSPGALKVVARKNGRVVATDVIHTAGAPAQVTLSADRTQIADNGEDLSFIKVAILDKDGRVCPNADNEITFSVKGTAAAIAGLDNGDPTNHEPFQGTKHKAFHGLALVVLKAHNAAIGPVMVTATAGGLPAATTTVTVVDPTLSN
jgi:beta-galactosidase